MSAPILSTNDLPVAPPLGQTSAEVVDGRDIRPLGQILLEDDAVSAQNLFRATIMRRRQDVPLGEILLARGWVSEQALTRALARQWRTNVIDLAAIPPDPRLIDEVGADICLSAGFVPWRRVGRVTFIAASRPDEFDDWRDRLAARFGEIRMLLCSDLGMREAILGSRRTALARRAETRVPAAESCRTRNDLRVSTGAGIAIAAVAAGAVFAPLTVLSIFTLWAILTLIATMTVKLAAFASVLHETWGTRRQIGAANLPTPPEMKGALPIISVMVPLYGEADIADKLVGRLSRLKYPRELTDILIVVEETDKITTDALAVARLPNWIRVVTVPDGPIKTKPRALNYALNFCRGRIVGVWDAEDRPEPNQLHKVARHFHFAPPDVACVQGVLDYYNPRTNWLSRCFTIEYASWFRANLRGVARLGLVVPLGGTTMFIRRDALEAVGCWDAHNVTEDADLGVRLARRGWRTEMIDTVTHEEANCRAVPWIKQRSRWLKGYAMTWAVHMRRPRALWSDLGPRRFFGFQAQFLGGLSQYLLAPVLWSLWLLTLGLPHPLTAPLGNLWGGYALPALISLLVVTEAINLVSNLWAVRKKEHRHLLAWVPTMSLYFPLGCAAGWKAIYEVVIRPFYWDKTVHGVDANEETESPPTAPAVSVESGTVVLKVSGKKAPGSRTAITESIPVFGQIG